MHMHMHALQDGVPILHLNQRNLPFTVLEEKKIHSSNEGKRILILSSAYMEMLALRMT